MKKLVVLLAIATMAGAVNGSTVCSFAAPNTSVAFDVDYYNGYLYHIAGTIPVLYKLTLSGTVVSTHACPAGTVDVDVSSNGYIMYSSTSKYFYRYNTNFGLLSSFTPNQSFITYRGFAFNGQYLYMSVFYGAPHVWKMTTTGSILNTYTYSPIETRIGLDFFGAQVWYEGYDSPGQFKITRAGPVGGPAYESFLYPHTPGACGLTWDGNYIWVISRTEQEQYWFYRLTTNDTSALPSSLGRVKAIYR